MGKENNPHRGMRKCLESGGGQAPSALFALWSEGHGLSALLAHVLSCAAVIGLFALGSLSRLFHVAGGIHRMAVAIALGGSGFHFARISALSANGLGSGLDGTRCGRVTPAVGLVSVEHYMWTEKKMFHMFS